MDIREIPNHVAIIMDGNGRWARNQGKPRHAGHKAGVQSVKTIVKKSLEKGVKVLTLFAFSSENWRRPRKEVGLLMDLFLNALRSEVRELDKNGIRLIFIGERKDIPVNVQRAMEEVETQTADNDRMTLVIAVSYGGQWDITQSVKQLLNRIQSGELPIESLTQDSIEDHLSTVGLPAPDLFIRTGGERRISNFLLWQLAYTELYFTDTLWPDFDEKAFILALDDYANRQRRYGMTSEQVISKRASHA
ncbi:MAG: isoprenyl transferase [Gammaproteobacteria bacterium]|nr:MAG: isoprenyl transferase [Gammaproteobacteria bacterium]